MPMNPMQRRANQSFWIGFLIALILGALAVAYLVNEVNKKEEMIAELEALKTDVLVAVSDLKSGQAVTLEKDFEMQSIQTTVDPSQVISEDDFMFYDENGEPLLMLDGDGIEVQKTLIMKVGVPAGTVVTKDMLAAEEDLTREDERLMEYNMILLPSQLENGDYIDIRLTLATGETYIVVSKEQVMQTTGTGVWLKLNEEQILTLENAIVESYQLIGSKLYATMYVEPGIQDPAHLTYPVSDSTRALINADPNILVEAKNELAQRYLDQQQVTQRVDRIEPALVVGGGAGAVATGVEEEAAIVQTQREEYIKALEGTGRIGADAE